MVTAPLPRVPVVEALPIWRVPSLMVVVPVYALLLSMRNVPGPVFTSEVSPPILPAIVLVELALLVWKVSVLPEAKVIDVPLYM